MVSRYVHKMNADELLAAICTEYTVDLEEGEVKGKRGQKLKYHQNQHGHSYVRIYYNGRCKAIAVHRVVWMVGCKSTIPHGWQVHHRDFDVTNNAFNNLVCLHPTDHKKYHVDLSEVPF